MAPEKHKISPDDLVCMNTQEATHALRVQLVYAHDRPPNIFGAVYRPDAQLWLHRDLARVVLKASELLEGYRLVLYDGLRTVEAQDKMAHSAIVQANPHWLQEPGRLLSPPGAGAHPRGMAIDVSLETLDGDLLDMGTDFDYLAEDSSAAANPAHREYQALKPAHATNRAILNEAMLGAAQECGVELMPLPQEWWDFRLPPEMYERYEPLSDGALPAEMRMANVS